MNALPLPATVELRSKRFHLKQAVFREGGLRNFQDLLQDALSKLGTVAVRQQDYTRSKSAKFRVINWHGEHRGAICGQVISYDEDDNKLLFDPGKLESQFVQVRTVELSSHVGGDALVERILYFAAIGNYVVISAAVDLTHEQFESHLNWLLRTSAVMRGENKLSLVDPVAKLDQLDFAQVTAVTFPSELRYDEGEMRYPSSDGVLMESDAGLTGPAVAFLAGLAEEQGVGPFDVNVAGNVRRRPIDAKLTLKTPDGKAAEVLGSIVEHFRHAEQLPIIVHFSDGSTLSGDAMKISEVRSVECIGSHPSPESISQVMLEFFHDSVNNGLIVV